MMGDNLRNDIASKRLRGTGSAIEMQPAKGWLIALQMPPIVIEFFLNPETITDSKQSGWYSRDRYGQYAPKNMWAKGGARQISFTIHLDSRVMNINPLGVVNTGIEFELAKYQSLLYPKPTYDFKTFSRGIKSLLGFTDRQGVRFSCPPKVLFWFGVELLECVVTNMPIRKKAFDHNLNCIRASISVTLQVVGDSWINQANDVKRKLFATAGIVNTEIGVPTILGLLG